MPMSEILKFVIRGKLNYVERDEQIQLSEPINLGRAEQQCVKKILIPLNEGIFSESLAYYSHQSLALAVFGFFVTPQTFSM